MKIETDYQPVFYNGALWGFLKTTFDHDTNELTAEVAAHADTVKTLPQWVVDCYFGSDRPESVSEYEWNSVTFWPTNKSIRFPN
jgi:hypothetical protein